MAVDDILRAGETYVFGPVTSTKNTSMRGGAGGVQGSTSRSSSRTVAVTNHRILIDDSKASGGPRSIENTDIVKVFVKKRTKNNVTTLTLVKVETASGSVIDLNLKGIPTVREELFGETFPDATFEQVKAGSKGIIIVAAVVAVLIALCCVITIIIPLLSNN